MFLIIKVNSNNTDNQGSSLCLIITLTIKMGKLYYESWLITNSLPSPKIEYVIGLQVLQVTLRKLRWLLDSVETNVKV